MNNQYVAHVWAQNDDKTAKASNFFCEDGVIYSYGYHFPIGKFLDHKTVLMIKEGSSVSTSKHISHVRYALDRGIVCFYVPTLSQNRYSTSDMKTAYDGLIREIAESQLSLVRRRKNIDWHLNDHNALIGNANRLSKYFKLGFRKIPFINSLEDAAKGNVKHLAALKRSEAKRKREAIKETERRRVELIHLQSEALQAIEEWKTDPKMTLRYDHQRALLKTYLRMKSDCETVQTSQNAEFPADHAKKAWTFIQAVVKRGQAWQSNGTKVRLGHFKIDSISTNGDVKAGCHFLNYETMEDFANTQNWS